MDSHTLRKTRQRSALLDLLASTKSHPTAAWLYERLRASYPRMSLGTVYRNLGILAGMGLVRVLHCGSGTDRFDADTSLHYHVQCERCGRIDDVPLQGEREIDGIAARATGYLIFSHRIDFFGLCPSCQEFHDSGNGGNNTGSAESAGSAEPGNYFKAENPHKRHGGSK